MGDITGNFSGTALKYQTDPCVGSKDDRLLCIVGCLSALDIFMCGKFLGKFPAAFFCVLIKKIILFNEIPPCK